MTILQLNPEHLLLQTRKLVSARLAYFDAVEPLVARLTTDPRFAAEIRGHALNMAGALARVSPNTEPLDECLTQWVSQVEQGVRGWPGAAIHEAFVTRAVQSLRARVATVNCLQCAAGLYALCNGGAGDDQVVASGGQCLALLRDRFQIAMALTRWYYDRFSMLPAGRSWPTMRLGTNETLRVPHDVPVPYAVGGATVYGEVGGHPVSEIQVSIVPEKVDAATARAIWYIMLHECVVHAYQRLTPDGHDRGTDPFDAFAEGWMDWVAMELAGRDLGLAGATAPPEWMRTPVRSLPSLEEISVATNFHDARGDYLDKRPASTSLFVALGRRAARKFLHLLTTLPGSSADAWGWFLRVSLGVNVRPWPTDARTRFALRVDELLAESHELPSPDQMHVLAQLTSKYLLHQDLERLFGEVTGGP